MKKSIRLPGYDYTQPGAYFVTICTHQHQSIFGEIVDGEMVLNELGRIANKTWKEIPCHFSNTNIEYWIVMPNHIHGIIEIVADNRRDSACRISRLNNMGNQFRVRYQQSFVHSNLQLPGKLLSSLIPEFVSGKKIIMSTLFVMKLSWTKLENIS